MRVLRVLIGMGLLTVAGSGGWRRVDPPGRRAHSHRGNGV